MTPGRIRCRPTKLACRIRADFCRGNWRGHSDFDRPFTRRLLCQLSYAGGDFERGSRTGPLRAHLDADLRSFVLRSSRLPVADNRHERAHPVDGDCLAGLRHRPVHHGEVPLAASAPARIGVPREAGHRSCRGTLFHLASVRCSARRHAW